jgi:hypothetical protein
MNSGSRLWIISEEMSISMLTKPRAQIPDGILPSVAVVAVVMMGLVVLLTALVAGL